MRTTFALAALLLSALAVSFVALSPSEADAGPVWKATLTSADAGGTQTVQISAKQCYCVQPSNPSAICLHFDNYDGGLNNATADCTKDLQLPVTADTEQRVKKYCFDSAGRTAIVARALDAGVVNAQLYQLELNPTSTAACTTGTF